MKSRRSRRGRTSPAVIERADREREAIALRRAGCSYDEIAVQVGYVDRSGAKKAVERGLSRWMREADAELRALELERTEALVARLWPQIDRRYPNLKALTAYLRLVDYRAKIAGLYAPQRQHVAVEVQGRVEHRMVEAMRLLRADPGVASVVDEHVKALIQHEEGGSDD